MAKAGAYKDRCHKQALACYTLQFEKRHNTRGTGAKKKPGMEQQRGVKLMLLWTKCSIRSVCHPLSLMCCRIKDC